jgi:hypothetical protein
MSAEQSQFNFEQPEPIDRIQVEFEVWLSKHGDVFNGLIKLAREAKAQGRGRYSVEALFVIYRWHRREPKKEAGDEYKLNDRLTSRLSRKIMEDCPDLKGFFEVRALKIERKGKRAA